MKIVEEYFPGISFSEVLSKLSSTDGAHDLKVFIDEKRLAVQKQYKNISNFPSLISTNPEVLIEYLRTEKYIDSTADKPLDKKIIYELYYLLRPLLPVKIRSKMQQFSLRDWHDIEFPTWPVDTTADDIAKLMLKLVIQDDSSQNSFVWFWPNDYSASLILTHDVETDAGLKNCIALMNLEEKYGFRSSFEIVPEKRYTVDAGILAEMRSRGFEICIHGLNHDGHLFNSREEFRKRKNSIINYARKYKAKGFRSPVMYRNSTMINELGFDYDMSFPNSAHLDPQRGGCCSVFPFSNGNTIELPLTTTQDYSLFNILNKTNINIWKGQVDKLIDLNGLISFIIHPDYMLTKDRLKLYEELLEFIAGHKTIWCTTPGVLSDWWRARSKISNIESIDKFNESSQLKASICNCCIDNNQLHFNKTKKHE